MKKKTLQSKTESVIQDAALRAWLNSKHSEGEVIDVIVEAELPQRRLDFSSKQSGGFSKQIETSDSDESRIEKLEAVNNELMEIVGDNTRVLKSAGAVVVHVNSGQLKQIAELAGVRAIRSNRRIKR